MARSCIVIGAGLGGLAIAIRLRHAGLDVTVLEKNERVGGRCNILEQDGYRFDTGPTLLLMRDVLDDLFSSVGRDMNDYLDLTRLSPNYQVHFADGKTLEFSSDFDKMARDLDAIEQGSGGAFRHYINDAGYKYRIARERFVERNFLHWYHFVTAANLYYLLRTNTLRKLERHARRYFRDPRLVSAFTFQTMYLGLAPRSAPAVYSLLPYTELVEGIWFPRGGMYQIALALEKLARELGVRIETSTAAERLQMEGSRVGSVTLASGESRTADVVVSNVDLPSTYAHLVPQGHVSKLLRWRLRHLNHGSSAFLMYLGVNRRYADLGHHEVYLSRDTKDNFDAIFRRFELPKDPSFYLCAPGRTDPSCAPEGHDALYVLVPVPRLSSKVNWKREAPVFKEMMYRRLEEVGLKNLRDHVTFERIYTPEDFVADYDTQFGSAFGISHNFTQVGYMRPSNHASGIDNLFFVGASTQPGGGVPMVLIGSRLTAERVVAGPLDG